MSEARFSMYFETEEDYIGWQERLAEAEAYGAKCRLEARELKELRSSRRPALFSSHTISKSVAKERSDDNMSCAWVEKHIEPVTGAYIGYRYKFNGKWRPEPDGYDEPSDGYYFAQAETVEVWLFVTHDNRKPVAVFPFDVEEKTNNDN